MYQIDNSTAAATLPASTAPGIVGFFTDGNAATGVPATILPAEFMNMLMLENINVLAAAGIAPSKSNFTQLLSAIRAVNKAATILADTGTAGAYSAVNSPALTALPVTGYAQWINIAHANAGASTYSPDGLAAKPIYGLGLQPLQGGELPVGIAVLRYLVQAGVNGGNGAWIITESFGGAAQLAQGTASNHAATIGQLQSGYGKLATDIGTANTIVCNPAPALTSVGDTTVITVIIAANNTGATTMNVSSTGATAVLGLSGAPLQGGELTAGNRATFMYASGSGWTLLYSQAAALQVGAATKSGQAMQLGQATGRLIAERIITSTATYTPTAGTVSVEAELQGGGGAGGGAVSTATGNTCAGLGGAAGAYVRGFFPVGTLTGLIMTIGSGGTGVAGSTGGSGNNTSFGGVMVAPGGPGGAAGQNLAPPWMLGEGGNSSIGTGGNIANNRGPSGAGSISLALGAILSGRGGNSPFGAGGNAVGTLRAAGNAGTGPGAGGSGALEQSAGAGGLAGGNGVAGVIILREYS